jgi:hypothetical protein
LVVNGTHGGRPYTWNYTALYDGAAHPVVGRPDVDAIVAHRVDDKTTLGIFKKGGIDVGLYARGATDATLHVLASGKNPDGTTYFNSIDYTK